MEELDKARAERSQNVLKPKYTDKERDKFWEELKVMNRLYEHLKLSDEYEKQVVFKLLK